VMILVLFFLLLLQQMKVLFYEIFLMHGRQF